MVLTAEGAEGGVGVLGEAAEMVGKVGDGVLFGAGEVMHVGIGPGVGHGGGGVAHEFGNDVEHAGIMDFGFEAEVADAGHKLVVFHVLLDETDD